MTTKPETVPHRDAELLSCVKAFWPAHKEATDSHERWIAEKNRAEALPGNPGFPFRDNSDENMKTQRAFMTDHGIDALSDANNEAWERQGRAAFLVFDIPAKTYQGVLAKLKIVEAAYGTGNGDGDMNLESYQDHDAPWLQNIIADFERLAGQVS